MNNLNWRQRFSYFIKQHDGPVSYWDISRVLASLTLRAFVIYLFVGAGLSLWAIYQAERLSYRDYQARTDSQRKEVAREIADRCNVITDPGITFHDCILREVLAYQETDTRDKDLQAQQDMARWAFWMLPTSIAGLFVSVGGLVMLWRSLQQTREAITTDREVGHAQVRAYLTIEPKSLSDLEVGKHPCAELHITNTGQSPAYDVRYIAAIFVRKHPLSAKDSPFISPDARQVPRVGNTVAAQGGFFAEAFGVDLLTKDTLAAAMSSKDERFYLSCIAYYRDVFGVDRETMMTAYFEQTGEPFTDPQTGEVARTYAWMISHNLNHAT